MSGLIPKKYVNKIEGLLAYSGSKTTPEGFIKKSVVLSLVVGIIIGLLSGNLLVVGSVVFLGMFALCHGMLILAVERRTGFVENILPDALQLVAANMRAGFIPSRALVLSARKEFGPLSEGIRVSGKEMVTGKSFQESLVYIRSKIKSDVLDTTIKLITRGVTSGGQMTSLFEETAADIRRRAAIKKEVKANIIIYGIFISFAAAIGAPALYALSGFLVETISKLSGATEIPKEFSSKIPLLKFGVDVSTDFLFLFSVIAIIITSFFAGLILGIINTGKEKEGIKYIPIFLIISLVIYFVAGSIIRSMFGNIVPGG